MSVAPDVLLAIVLMGIASYACRAGGFFLMRFVALTPRVEAWLSAIPIALIGAIVGPVAVKGGPPEWLGLGTAVALMRFTGNDFIGAIGAVAVVAIARAI
jgi:uncharacterized membrane protein